MTSNLGTGLYIDEVKVSEEIRNVKTDKQYYTYRHFLVILALVQCFIAAGIFYGWPSLYTMLLEEGIYNDRCPHPGEVCPQQTLDLGFIYTLGSCLNLVAQLVWGMVLDSYGPRMCSFLSCSMVLAGVGMLGVTSNEFDVLLPSMCCIAVGGPGASIACFHLSNLFHSTKNTVLSLFSGAFQLGFIVFLIFHEVNLMGVSRQHLCLVYGSLILIIIILGLLVWPDRSLAAPKRGISRTGTRERVDSYGSFDKSPSFIEQEKSFIEQEKSPSFIEREKYADSEADAGELPWTDSIIETPPPDRNFANPSLPHTPPALGVPSPGTPSNRASLALQRIDSDILSMAKISKPTVRRQTKRAKPLLLKEILSFPFFSLTVWMSIGLFWLNFYIGSVADQMFQQSSGNRKAAHTYTGYFTTTLPLGALAIPLYGYFTDRLGVPFAVLLSTAFGIAFSGMCTVENLELQLLTFVFYSLYRTFVFATFFSLVAKEFGYSSFGVISGLILCTSGIIGLLQYPVRRYGVPNESFKTANAFQLGMICITSCLFTAYIYYTTRMRASKARSIRTDADRKRIN